MYLRFETLDGIIVSGGNIRITSTHIPDWGSQHDGWYKNQITYGFSFSDITPPSGYEITEILNPDYGIKPNAPRFADVRVEHKSQYSGSSNPDDHINYYHTPIIPNPYPVGDGPIDCDYFFPEDVKVWWQWVTTIVVYVKESDKVTITTNVDPQGSGTTTGDGAYVKGSSVTITAVAAQDYAFQKWMLNGEDVSFNPSYTFTATSNATYTAVFGRLCKVIIQFEGPDGVQISGHRAKIGDRSGISNSSGRIELEDITSGNYEIKFDDRTSQWDYLLNSYTEGYSKLTVNENQQRFRRASRSPAIFPDYNYKTGSINVSGTGSDNTCIIVITIVRTCIFLATPRVKSFLDKFGWNQPGRTYYPLNLFSWNDLSEAYVETFYFSSGLACLFSPEPGFLDSICGKIRLELKDDISNKLLGGKSVFRFVGSSALFNGSSESSHFSIGSQYDYSVSYDKDAVNDFNYEDKLDDADLDLIDEYNLSNSMILVLDFVDEIQDINIRSIGFEQTRTPNLDFLTVFFHKDIGGANNITFDYYASTGSISDIDVTIKDLPICSCEIRIEKHDYDTGCNLKKITHNGTDVEFSEDGIPHPAVYKAGLTIDAFRSDINRIVLFYLLGIIYDKTSNKIIQKSGSDGGILCYA